MLLAHEPFQALVKYYITELQQNGYTFRMKAALQAEDLLQDAYLMAKSKHTPATVRADLIKWHAKVAALEPRDKEPGGYMGAGGFSVHINLGDSQKSVTLAAAPDDDGDTRIRSDHVLPAP